MSLVLDAAQLSRVFGKGENTFTAVDRVSLRVSSGEIHALLGPNGAGKTTTVPMLRGFPGGPEGTRLSMP